MNELKDDNIVLDVLENDHTWIYGLDKRLEDRQAWVARLKKRLVMSDTISSVSRAIAASKRNNDNNHNIWVPSIYKIPTCIRDVDPAAYEPQVLSLGPYNHNKPQLQAMDELKWCYFRSFLLRNPEKDLDDYLALVEELESQVRGAYSELEPTIDSKDFVQMMLLDCCFVLEFLLMSDDWGQGGGGEEEKGEEEDEEEEEEKEEEDEEEEEDQIDPIQNSAWVTPFVMRDMLLLENQLPFFLLERLLKLNIPHQTPSFSQIVHNTFWDLMPGKIQKMPTDMDGSIVVPIHHILHLMYSCTIPKPLLEDHPISPSPAPLPCLFKIFPRGARIIRRQVQNSYPGGDSISRVNPEEPTLLWIPCAKALSEAGVVFKRKRDYASFLDVTFDKGVMEIPPLQIFGYIDSIFRNLIAFEQCHTSNVAPFYVSAYAYLMNLIVDTTTDVELLKQEGIIVSTLGSDEDVATLFNQLRKNTTIDDNCYLSSVFDGVRLHCDKRANRWKATLNHNYFNSPWAIISVAAAILLFVLTIMQTILAFLSYLQPISG